MKTRRTLADEFRERVKASSNGRKRRDNPPVEEKTKRPRWDAGDFEVGYDDVDVPAELNEAPDDPHLQARTFLEDYRTEEGVLLRYYREEYHLWDGIAYRVLPEQDVRALACARIKRDFNERNPKEIELWRQRGEKNEMGKPCPMPTVRKVTKHIVADVLQAIVSETLLSSRVEVSCWLGGDEYAPAADILPCKNGLVDLPRAAAGDGCLYPPTPRFFSTNGLDYNFDANAPEPAKWLEFLGKLWPDDPQAIDALAEWFGYCLAADTSQQKILLLVGPKRGGKGTIARVLTKMLGAANVCGPTLASLGMNFGLWSLLNKPLAIISDARLSNRSDTAVVVERLLSISGEDAVSVDRKYLNPITTKLPTRFAILTNELPRLNDASGALAGRVIILQLKNSWYGREDVKLSERLYEEVPGILLWALEGLRRLRERGHFVQPESSRLALQDLEDLSSPVGAFLRECCEVGPGYTVLVRDLFAAWQTWCNEKGRKEPGTEQGFGRDLRAATPSLEVRQPRADGGRVRVYEGIRLRSGF
jgi:putative DNA primase/helicase